MRKATILSFLFVLLIIFTSCTQSAGVKSGSAAREDFLEFLPRSMDFILVMNVERLMAIEAIAQTMEGPGSDQGLVGMIKMMGIDPKKDVKSACFGFPAAEHWRLFFLGMPTRQALIESAAIVVDLRYDKDRLQGSIKDRIPGVQVDSYTGVAIYNNMAADDRWKWIRAACLDEAHIVLGSDKGVKAVIDVYQKRAEPLSKAPEMTAVMRQIDKSGIAWCAASAPAELFREIASSNPQLADLEWLKGITLAVDDKKSGIVIEIRSIGGNAKQNEASASVFKGLRAYGAMHLANEPALEELLNSFDITSADGSIRLAGSASHEAVGLIWRLAREKTEVPTKPDEVEPREAGAGVPGPVQDKEAGKPADAAFHEKIRAQADEMHRAIMSGDLDKFMTFMLPQVIAGAGGAAALKQAIQPGLAQMRQMVERISIGTISPVASEAAGLAAFVPIEMDFRINETRLIQITYDVAYSEDMGLTWKFMSSQGQPQQDLLVKRMFPQLVSRRAPPKCGQFIPFWR